MKTVSKSTTFKNLLKDLAITDVSRIIRDTLLTEILCKISDFSDEVKHFEEKYGKNLSDFIKEYESNDEDFEKYDDLMAWEFAQQGKQYWETKLKEAKSVL
ncbi:MAG: hypothetical protein ISS28_00440 [Candidatus Cloacimonetes bacterium]|nr:hypothetical protein [Candidatus Cloacimonadota bacterium]MBL7085555.1 hypothetical protein [Candidatus Cloacimonadota bacterium]